MDAKTLAVSVANGIASLPMDFYLGIERTFQDLNLANGGRKIQRRNFGDDERMYRALNKIFRNRAILEQIAKMIIKDSLSFLPDPALKKITEKLIGTATSLGSRQSMQLAITGYPGSRVVGGMMASVITKLSLRLWTGTLAGGIVLQGVLSCASVASRRLRHKILNYGQSFTYLILKCFTSSLKNL